MTSKVTFIRKAANTLAVSTKDGNIFGEFFKKCSLNYFVKKYNEKFKKEHYDAIKDIIHVFADLRKNHVILHAPTQSGKTTVMTLLYNIVNECESYLTLKQFLGIKKVIYLTGDNQCELSEQTMTRFREQCKLPMPPIRLSGNNPCSVEEFPTLVKEWSSCGKTPFIMVKNGDCKKFREKVKDFTLNNTLIMVDESHYGTKDINSQLNKLFHEFGKDFSGDPKKLSKTNTYILSVSATPYNEEFADRVNTNGDLLKGIVHYKPGKGYIGFSTMYKAGMIIGLRGNSDVTDKSAFISFLKEQREKMDKIYDETNGQRHAVIMRMQGKKTLLTELGKQELSKIAAKYGFKLMLVDCKNTSKRNIDYDNAYNEIEYSQFPTGKNILIVVKQGFSYGISIPDNVKPLISTIYDYRPSFSNSTTDSTEQGLLGRMTGYHPNGLSKYLKIYISEEHLNGLYGYHCEYPPTESPMPSTKKGKKEQCSEEEWEKGEYKNDLDKRNHIVLWNNSKLEPLVYNGKTVDDFFARHPEFDYEKLFSKEEIKGHFLTKILTAFNHEILNDRFDDKKRVDARRQIGNNSVGDKVSATLGFVTPILSNSSRYGWRKPENEGKEGWAFVVDITKAKGKKGIEIRIPYGTIGFSKDTISYRQRKNWNGYQKYQKKELAMAEAK